MIPRLTQEEIDKFKTILYRLDWIEIMKEAIEWRPTSWNDHPIREWRNASDCVCGVLVKKIEERLKK